MQFHENDFQECYVTRDHEWVAFSHDHNTGYVGVSDFKLSGLLNIQQVDFVGIRGVAVKGQLLVNLISDDYIIPVHMPVEGEVVSYNDVLQDTPSLILRKSQRNNWLVRIKPTAPLSMTDLLLFDDYIEKYPAKLYGQ